MKRQCRIRWHLNSAVAIAISLLVTTGCASFQQGSPRPGFPQAKAVRIYPAADPSASENYCAWYGDASAGILFTGLSPFWSAMRSAGGDPQADLASPGPQWVGRFDLAGERWLPPLDVGGPDSRAGVWDVHAQGGQLYFTTFFEGAGSVDLASGRVRRFSDSNGLNEIESGPADSVLISRYGSGDSGPGDGELVLLEPDGKIRERVRLDPPPGLFVAPKTPAWDAARELFWATSDLIAADGSASERRDAFRVSRANGTRELQAEPEIQFARFDPEGGVVAELDREGRLWLRLLAPSDPPDGGRRQLLDPAFPGLLDFVQDIKRSREGVVLTRWSGIIHVVRPTGEIRSVTMPRIEAGGLYYTAVLQGDRLCATYCGGVRIVCADAP